MHRCGRLVVAWRKQTEEAESAASEDSCLLAAVLAGESPNEATGPCLTEKRQKEMQRLLQEEQDGRKTDVDV